jgi:hypothetical protein
MARKWHLPKLRLPQWRLPKISFRRVLAVAADIGMRLYSLAILLLLVWTGYLAVTYLRGSVFQPSRIPQRLLNWQGRLDVGALRQNNVPGMTGPEGRAPSGHYHGIDRWFQADTFNTCTTTGCHQPLPHTTKNAKAPAFANFHATFLACQMCHTDVRTKPDQPGQAMWLDLSNGQVEDCPPILSLMRYLDTQGDAIKADPAAHQVITSLLSQSIAAIGKDPALEELLQDMQTSAPGSPFWHQAEKSLVTELPSHARGEYAAKLAPPNVAQLTTGQRKKMTELAGQFLEAPADGPLRKELKQAIHQGLLKEPVACTACHGDAPPLLDFEKLGYSPQRAAALHSVPLAQIVQGIRRGEPFFIPQMLETPQ